MYWIQFQALHMFNSPTALENKYHYFIWEIFILGNEGMKRLGNLHKSPSLVSSRART